MTMCANGAAMEASFRKAAPSMLQGDVSSRPTKLFIGGISRHTTTKQLRDHFSQFGRVLDCVAMRTQDGHPRGFGYVTLDSSAAAERCLREPQCIDNRIVDMKAAVPEGSGASPAGSNFNMGMFGGQADYSMCNDWSGASTPMGGAFPWWSGDALEGGAAMPGQGLDCLDLLSAARRPQGLPLHSMGADRFLHEYADLASQDPLDGMGLLLPPYCSSELQPSGRPVDFQMPTSPTGVSAMMSASAPEFVPLGAQVLATDATKAPGLSGATPQKPNARALGKSRGAFSVIDTNIVQVEDLMKSFKSPSKKSDVGHGHIHVPKTGSLLGPIAAPTNASQLPVFEDELLNVSSPSDSKIKLNVTPSTSDELLTAEAKPDEDTPVEEEEAHVSPSSCGSDDDDDESPTIEVDMTNLPSIGSVAHASGDCKRCNFFAKGRCQNGKDCTFCHFPHDKCKLSRQEKRERRAAWMGEGMGELCEEKLAALQGGDGSLTNSMFPETGLALPPGLVPCSMPPMSQTLPAFLDPYMFQPLVSSAAGLTSPHLSSMSSIFSTVPSAASTPFPTPAPTPTAGAAPTMFPATCESATMTSGGTQTGSYKCKKCEVNSSPATKSTNDNQADQWARDELLRFRDTILKMHAGEKRSLPIRTEAIAALGGA